MKLFYTKKEVMKIGEMSYRKGYEDATNKFKEYLASDQLRDTIKGCVRTGIERYARQECVAEMIAQQLNQQGYVQTEEGAFIPQEDEE